MARPQPEHVGLPIHPFLYTLDQISSILSVAESTLKQQYLYFEGRSVGIRPKNRMATRNIAPEGEPPEWRVAERELIRFLKVKGFRFYERGWLLR